MAVAEACHQHQHQLGAEGLEAGKALQKEFPDDAFVYGVLTDANAELGNYDAAVDAAFARIQRDGRHHALVVLSNRSIAAREFGEWAMAYGAPGEDRDAALERVTRLVAQADPVVRATFEGFAKVRRAA